MEELLSTVCGERVGEGSYRDVFDFVPFLGTEPEYVIKIARDKHGRECNFLEYGVWEELCCSIHKKWFAPVVYISDCGTYLIQQKARIRDHEAYPSKIPHFFMDVKRDNLGFIGDQLVCFDYGNTIITQGFTKRMVKCNINKENE